MAEIALIFGWPEEEAIATLLDVLEREGLPLEPRSLTSGRLLFP